MPWRRLGERHTSRPKWQYFLTAGLLAAGMTLGGFLAIRFIRSCVVHGKRYYSGEAVPCSPCNECWCLNGSTGSTAMACARLPDARVAPPIGNADAAPKSVGNHLLPATPHP